jgi:hypothetical protein
MGLARAMLRKRRLLSLRRRLDGASMRARLHELRNGRPIRR